MSLKLSVLAALAISIWLGGAGCGSPSKCNVTCAADEAIVDQTALTSPIVTVAAEGPCIVSQFSVDGGSEVRVNVNNGGPAPSAGSCKIDATLADGSTWVAVLSWALERGGCCPQYNFGPAPVFMAIDGGTP